VGGEYAELSNTVTTKEAAQIDSPTRKRLSGCRSARYIERRPTVEPTGGNVMAYEVDFNNVSTIGLESSPVAGALAGLRANEARFLKNKFGHVFTVEPASKAQKTIDWVHRILKEERDLV